MASVVASVVVVVVVSVVVSVVVVAFVVVVESPVAGVNFNTLTPTCFDLSLADIVYYVLALRL